jgi:2-polyprenyl-6-hydroxyphenyl methylase/3-demethylubiquinone-9 3-methyltransferase
MSTATASMTAGHELRFEFGKNWARFLSTINEARVQEAELSLKQTLRIQNLVDKSFLDVGSGSGLFSLAARRLGARVHSFDYDANSVGCTRTLRERFFPGDDCWTVERGSALDDEYIHSLGQFDFVYSFGVLHHTGNLWKALELAAYPVCVGGHLFVSIYNDQGTASKWWTRIKVVYNRLPRGLRFSVLLPSLVGIWGPIFLRDALRLNPLKTWTGYKTNRGMSAWHDLVDWVGGYPFEVAKPEAVFQFYKGRGFRLEGLSTCAGGSGCNQFLFLRER